MKYYEDYTRHDLQIGLKESIRHTKRASNQDHYDDTEMTFIERMVYLVSLLVLTSGWMWLFFWAFTGDIS
jgi:hypothetical protein